jgi:hypothetical protein
MPPAFFFAFAAIYALWSFNLEAFLPLETLRSMQRKKGLSSQIADMSQTI